MKYAVIGFDTTGNPLEIMYNPIDNNTINVFHAMKARKSFLAKLGLLGDEYGKNDRTGSMGIR